MTDLTCDEFHALSAELALGVLHGRERADALAHVQECAACQREVLSMGDVADRLVGLTPSAEPPAGFETRVLARLAVSRGESRRRRGPVAIRLAVAAAVAAAVGLGGWTIGHDRGPVAPVAANLRDARTAALVTAGVRVGQVVTFGGGHPWVAVALDGDLGVRTVTCELVGRNGKVTTVGTYPLGPGYAYWGAPMGVEPSSVARVQLVDTSGKAVATASF